MATKNELSRITIEIPKVEHQRLKARAAMLGKSMKEVILEMLEMTEECLYSNHYPNKETQKSIENIEKGENLVEIKSLEELRKKLGL